MEKTLENLNKRDTKYVLAMYDVRGKQEFIYRSSKIKEIIGGSFVIADIYKDYLYPVAEKHGKGIFHDSDKPFTQNAFIQHMSEGYIGEVVYEGGGNFFVLYKNRNVWREVNQQFTRSVFDAIGTLKVLSTCIEIDGFDDYKGNVKTLMDEHKLNEAIDPPVMPTHVLPIAMRDRQTSMSITHRVMDEASNKELELSTENFRKRVKFNELRSNRTKDQYGNREYLQEGMLDKLVSKKGEDSMLAVIYIDGNGMGAKVERVTGGLTKYDDAVGALRGFSKAINEEYVKKPIEKIGEYLNKDGSRRSRLVVGAGDEMTIICNAHDAIGIVRTYFKAQAEQGNQNTSCAGIAVFHSHAPFADAYRFAEACCESGKKRMKKMGIENARLLDFHMIQSGMSVSLETTRRYEAGDIITKPWYIFPNELSDEDGVTYDIDGTDGMINKVVEYLGSMSRSNIKELADHALAGEMELMRELMRIEAHRRRKDAHGRGDNPDDGITTYQKLENEIESITGWERCKTERMLRGMIYDVVLGWDLWFADDYKRMFPNSKRAEGNAENEENT